MAVGVKSKIFSFDIKYRITSRLICKQILPDICFNQNDCEWGRITAVWRILKFSNTKFYKIPSNILIQTAMDVVRLLKNRIINHRIFDRKKYVAVVTKAKKNILGVLQIGSRGILLFVCLSTRLFCKENQSSLCS